MRTTVDLDAPLLARARRQAARRGQTLSIIVREALSTYLAQTALSDEASFELLTCGESGGYAPTPAEMADEMASEDAHLTTVRGRRRGRP